MAREERSVSILLEHIGNVELNEYKRISVDIRYYPGFDPCVATVTVIDTDDGVFFNRKIPWINNASKSLELSELYAMGAERLAEITNNNT